MPLAARTAVLALLAHGLLLAFVHRTNPGEFPRTVPPEVSSVESDVVVDLSAPEATVAASEQPSAALSPALAGHPTSAVVPVQAGAGEGRDGQASDLDEPKAPTPAITSGSGWFSPFASGSPGAIDLRPAIPPASSGTASAGPPNREGETVAQANARIKQVLVAAVDAHEVERGTARGGEAVTAVQNIAHMQGAPGLGVATFSIRVGRDGVTVALLDGGAEANAWRGLLPALRAQMLAHPPAIPPGKQGLSLVVATKVEDQCPSGKRPTSGGGCSVAGGPKFSGGSASVGLSPEDLGARPVRMAHTHLVSSEAY